MFKKCGAGLVLSMFLVMNISSMWVGVRAQNTTSNTSPTGLEQCVTLKSEIEDLKMKYKKDILQQYPDKFSTSAKVYPYDQCQCYTEYNTASINPTTDLKPSKPNNFNNCKGRFQRSSTDTTSCIPINDKNVSSDLMKKMSKFTTLKCDTSVVEDGPCFSAMKDMGLPTVSVKVRTNVLDKQCTQTKVVKGCESEFKDWARYYLSTNARGEEGQGSYQKKIVYYQCVAKLNEQQQAIKKCSNNKDTTRFHGSCRDNKQLYVVSPGDMYSNPYEYLTSCDGEVYGDEVLFSENGKKYFNKCCESDKKVTNNKCVTANRAGKKSNECAEKQQEIVDLYNSAKKLYCVQTSISNNNESDYAKTYQDKEQEYKKLTDAVLDDLQKKSKKYNLYLDKRSSSCDLSAFDSYKRLQGSNYGMDNGKDKKLTETKLANPLPDGESCSVDVSIVDDLNCKDIINKYEKKANLETLAGKLVTLNGSIQQATNQDGVTKQTQAYESVLEQYQEVKRVAGDLAGGTLDADYVMCHVFGKYKTCEEIFGGPFDNTNMITVVKSHCNGTFDESTFDCTDWENDTVKKQVEQYKNYLTCKNTCPYNHNSEGKCTSENNNTAGVKEDCEKAFGSRSIPTKVEDIQTKAPVYKEAKDLFNVYNDLVDTVKGNAIKDQQNALPTESLNDSVQFAKDLNLSAGKVTSPSNLQTFQSTICNTTEEKNKQVTYVRNIMKEMVQTAEKHGNSNVDIEALKSDIASLDGKIATWNTAIKTANQELNDLLSEKEQLSTKVRDLETEKEAAQQNNQSRTQESDLTQAKQQLKDLTNPNTGSIDKKKKEIEDAEHNKAPFVTEKQAKMEQLSQTAGFDFDGVEQKLLDAVGKVCNKIGMLNENALNDLDTSSVDFLYKKKIVECLNGTLDKTEKIDVSGKVSCQNLIDKSKTEQITMYWGKEIHACNNCTQQTINGQCCDQGTVAPSEANNGALVCCPAGNYASTVNMCCANGVTTEGECLTNAYGSMGIDCTTNQLINGSCSMQTYKLFGIRKDDPDPDPMSFIQDIILAATSFIGTVVTITLLISGFKFVTAGADSNQATSAKKGIKLAIIGLALVAFSYVAVRIVQYLAKG